MNIETIGATGQIAKALAAAQAEMHNPTFDSVNPHYSSKFATLASVRNAVIPALAKHQIAMVQEITTTDNGVACVCHLYHESGEALHFGPLVIPATKQDAHGYASAATYARRYSLMAVAQVVGDDDDDGNTAVEQTAKAEKVMAELRRKHLDSVTYIKDALREDRMEDAAAAWFELPNEAKEALWTAPTRGGLFTTAEREIMKTKEFRLAGKGE